MRVPAAFAGHAERRAAAARRRRVGVLDREATAGHRVDEVDLGALQVADTDRVDEQPDAVRLEHLVTDAAAFLDHEPVLEARAAAALDEHAQAAAGLTLFIDPVSLSYLKGAEVDFVDTITGGGFTIKNPNATSTCGCGSSFSA